MYTTGKRIGWIRNDMHVLVCYQRIEINYILHCTNKGDITGEKRRNRIMASGGERQKQENYIYVIKVCNLAPHSQSTFSVPSRVAVKVMAYRDDLSHNSWAVEDVVHIQQWVSHYR